MIRSVCLVSNLLYLFCCIQTQMNGKKIVILLYCLTVLGFAFTLQPNTNNTPYESGKTTLFLEGLQDPQHNEQIFSFNTLQKYSAQAEVIVTIAGFQLPPITLQTPSQQTQTVASVVGQMQRGQELKMIAKQRGGMMSLQINYLIVQQGWQWQMGALLWDSKTKVGEYLDEYQTKLTIQQELIQIGQPKQKQYKSHSIKDKKTQPLQIISFVSTLAISNGQMIQLLDVRVISYQRRIVVKVGIPSQNYLHGVKLAYKLVITRSNKFQQKSGEKYVRLINRIEQISLNRPFWYQSTKPEQSLILGLISLTSQCTSHPSIYYQQKDSIKTVSISSTQKSTKCTYTAHLIGLELLPYHTNQLVPARMLATVCTTPRTYYGINDYMQLATSTSPGAWYSCPWWAFLWCRQSCKPCPIGCSTCNAINCGSWYITCSSCMTGFIKNSTGSCSGQTYCSCPTAGTYPDVSNTCKNCTDIIPNCNSCSSTYYVGTFCASCNIGYYRTSSSYARSCAACSPGCKNCTSSSACLSCINNLVVISSACTCNTSQSYYYNSATSSCTSCSTAIPNCLSCSLSGLTTSCTSCKTGYYIDPTTKTCIQCAQYCSVCTATGCTTCVSTTMTLTGSTCVCSSPLFLNISSTPPSCSACTNFQPNCLTCVNSGGSILCQTCNAGYYVSGSPGACISCVTNCLSCTDGTSCSSCKTNFTFNAVSGQCECSPGFVSNGANSCIQCAYLIPGCQTCGPNGAYCVTCTDPYYNTSVNGASCTLCPLQCSSCVAPGTGACTGCITGYDFTGTSCVCNNCPSCASSTNIPLCSSCTGSSCASCTIGYYYDSGVNNCTACPAACSTCTSATGCTTCVSPFIFVSPNCVCNNALQQYYNPTTHTCVSSCGSVYVNCTACTGTVSSGSVSTTTCTACVAGTYLFNSTTCSLCPSTCLQCNSATDCTICPATFYIINGVCSCDTNSQYFLNLNLNTCQFCDTLIPFCSICQINGSTTSQVGCNQCYLGYYNDASDTCTLCPLTCISCTSATTCASCKNTYSLINGSCVCDASKELYDTGSQCQPCYTFVDYCTQCTYSGGVTCATCVTGSYLNSPSNTACILCPSNCNACDPTGCTTCILGFVPVGGICQFTNNCQNYVGVDPNCASCNTVNSTNTTTTICQGCLAGFYLVNNVSCLPCPSTCKTCLDYSICLVCSPTFTYVDGVCTCDALANQVLYNSKCVSCGTILGSCLTCNSTAMPVSCTSCMSTYYLDSSGNCVSCPSGCTKCYQNGSCTQCLTNYNFDPILLTCTSIALCATNTYYDGTSCLTCPMGCAICLDYNTCLGCQASYSYIDGICMCDSQHGMFYSPQVPGCSQCGNYISSTYLVDLTLNCLTCINSTTYPSAGFECLICNTGYYVSSGQCYQCQPGCNQCSGATNCYKCIVPDYILNSTGGCQCNQMINYFLNGTQCDLCVITNCTICLTINTCQNCTPGSFVNSSTHICQPQICGNSRREGAEQCDDGNVLDGDGCDMYCYFEPYFVCSNLVQGSLSICEPQSGKFKLELVEQNVKCNKIQLKLANVGTQAITACDITNLMPSYEFTYATLQSHSLQGKYITYLFTYNQTIENQTFNLIFNPTSLCIPNALHFPPFNITMIVSPTNNQLALYYQEGQCTEQATAQLVVNTIQYVSYATLFLSALPCKIVGLQLFGVLQLSYLSVGSMDNVNLLLQPLANLQSVNGYQLDLGNDRATRLLQVFTPQRINSIDYKANFIRNCNVMFLVVVAIIGIAFLMYVISRICHNCATFAKITKRLSKEVLLTLILFNELNFAYSAGLHFKYAPKQDPLYFMGTIAAACTLVIPVLMAIALLVSEEQGFGEFKDKLKPGCLQRAYFVVTIVYRLGIGMYMASANEDPLSTLIILAFSIFFLVYNLVNLPFAKAYHNYRANICHLTQFVILFVAMYYRSMKSTTAVTQISSIFSPVYLQYILIIASVLASLVVLCYQIYLFIKQCCNKKQTQNKVKQCSDQNIPNQSINKLHQRDITMIKVENIEIVDNRVDTINPIYDEYS